VKGPVITFWRNLTATKDGSEWCPESWGPVLDRLSQSKPFRGDQEHPGWSAARFEPCERAAENVREVFALCLDYDNKAKNGAMVSPPVTIASAAELWGKHLGLIHTSRSHTPDWPRFRVVLPLSRPVSKFEYAALWLRVKDHAGAVDDAPKDPSRFWFLPGVREGGTFDAHRLTGDPLDVDHWLARPEPQAKAATRPRQVEPRRGEPVDAERRAIAYVRRMDGSIAGQGGDDQLWRAACHVGCGFDLTADQTFRILRDEFNPRCLPPWDENRLWHKSKQSERSTLRRGYLLDVERSGPGWVSATEPDLQPEVEESDIEDRAPPSDGQPNEREPGDDSEEIRVEQAKPKSAVERYKVLTERQLAVAVFEDATCGLPARGFTTGIDELDEAMCGIRVEHVLLAAAQTSWGKSTLASLIVTENRKAKVPTLLVSNEDKPLMYGRRLACSSLSINALRLRDRELTPKEVGILGDYATRSPDEYLFLDAVGMPVEQVGQAIRELCAECGFKLVICDYLQRFRSASANDRRNEVTHAMETLTNEIKNAKAAGVIMSQLKRTDGKSPTMNDVKESGDVENMAEHVLIGWRDVEKPRDVHDVEKIHRKFNLPKNKDGVASEEWTELHFDEVRAAFTGKVVGDDGRPIDRAKTNARPAPGNFDDFADNSSEMYP
jgi:hypothetical protein